MKETTKKDINNLYNALKVLKDKLTRDPNTNVSQFVKGTYLDLKIVMRMKDKKILEHNSKNGRGSQWTWVGGDPSIEMAKELLEIEGQEVVKVDKPKQPKRKKTMQIKWFWGLFYQTIVID